MLQQSLHPLKTIRPWHRRFLSEPGIKDHRTFLPAIKEQRRCRIPFLTVDRMQRPQSRPGQRHRRPGDRLQCLTARLLIAGGHQPIPCHRRELAFGLSLGPRAIQAGTTTLKEFMHRLPQPGSQDCPQIQGRLEQCGGSTGD